MKTEKMLYRGLKWLFSFLVGLMGLAIIGCIILCLFVNFSPESIHTQAFLRELSNETISITTIASPLFAFSIILNCFLYGYLFLLVRTFFKNLENDWIFVPENVIKAKRIALTVLILSISSCLPEILVSSHNFSLDLSYVAGAAIIWALSKILEKANAIAEENKLTV